MTATVGSAPVASVPELNLLLEWPNRRSPAGWLAIISASLTLHAVLFAFVIETPSLIPPTGIQPPERRVIVHEIPLYIPRDILTQKAPNVSKPTRNIDLASLLASRPQKPSPGPSRRRFEVPQNVTVPQPKANTPQIVAEAPNIPVNPSPLPAAPIAPPAPAPLQAPKNRVEAAIQSLAQNPNGKQLTITDDNLSEPAPAAPAANGQAEAAHATVELQSDPRGTDFRAYLAQILSIVRRNWRRVTPESVRLGTLRGQTVIDFVIRRDGSIPKLVIAEPSNIQALDRASVAGLSMSNPLPPLPADFKGFEVRLAFTFSYNMPTQ
ncbi:MAG: TonB C-terminal domain-containing protein [Acidobacteriaceae bacterium]|nr:TonB C-terminal domain-containing protein [Acidobacteriaceae bacterium]